MVYQILYHSLITLLGILLLPSCATLQFYGQAVGGQVEIFAKSRSILVVLADRKTSPKLRAQLIKVQMIRRFASDELTLPGTASYGNYANLGRDYVTWVLYAAPEFSLEPKRWWYPTLGKLGYRGFFREDDAKQLAGELRKQGYDVEIGGVEAYSTLGWFHDPVLNCFVDHSEISLAELIFHELTHRRLFRSGDTAYNESLATAFAEEAVQRWLRAQSRYSDLLRYRQLLVRRNQFYEQIEVTRRRLESLYQSPQSIAKKRREKARILADLRHQFLELRRSWGGRGLDSWLTEDLNNAHLVSITTYQKNVPIFQCLLRECDGDFDQFFKRAASLKVPH
jgi:predicted aminopeptidase